MPAVMQLDLTRYRQPEAHFSRTFRPEEVAQEGDAYRIVAPVQLDFDIQKDKDACASAKRVEELVCAKDPSNGYCARK